MAFSIARRICCVVREELYTVLVSWRVRCIKVEVNGSGSTVLGYRVEGWEVDVVVGAGVGVAIVISVWADVSERVGLAVW